MAKQTLITARVRKPELFEDGDEANNDVEDRSKLIELLEHDL
jgi:hypothetical protein